MRYLILFSVFLIASSSDAGPLRNRRQVQQSTPSVAIESGEGAKDALEEVNADRAARGLPPFVRDEGLTTAAKRCAATRARWGIRGHLGGQMGDFAALPEGVSASAAGCGALEPEFGFAACCVYDNYKYAGAATVWVGNVRFNHIFVR